MSLLLSRGVIQPLAVSLIIQTWVRSWFKISELSGTAPIKYQGCRITGQPSINASMAKMPCFSPPSQPINVVMCFRLPIICNQENGSKWLPKCSVGKILLESWAKWDIPQKVMNYFNFSATRRNRSILLFKHKRSLLCGSWILWVCVLWQFSHRSS